MVEARGFAAERSGALHVPAWPAELERLSEPDGTVTLPQAQIVVAAGGGGGGGGAGAEDGAAAAATGQQRLEGRSMQPRQVC